MAWTDVICIKCNKEYQVQMYGSIKTREWKIDNWAGTCDECKESQKQELMQQNKNNILPELRGSDKQIAWAMKIRESILQDLQNIDLPEDSNLINTAIETISNITSSHEWIEIRNIDIYNLVKKEIELLKESVKDNIIQDLEKDVYIESILKSKNPVTNTIADITYNEKSINIHFPEKNEKFKSIIKSHQFYWSGTWKKSLSFKTENVEDRVAEIGHKLVSYGFGISIFNNEIKEKIVKEDFTQEQTRWISVLSEYKNTFYIQWAYGDTIYSAAKRIPGSKYYKPGILIPIMYVNELLDFAEIYDFKFSKGAKKLIKIAIKEVESIKAVDLKEIPKKEMKSGTKIPELIIPENIEIPDEFKD